MKAHFLILGVSSYISGFFLDKIDKNYCVVGLEKQDEPVEKDNVTIIKHFDYSISNLTDVLKKYTPDKIINFVGVGKAKIEVQNCFEYFYDINCKISVNLLEAVRQIKNYDPKIVLIGSAAEYGLSDNMNNCVYTEESVAKPQSFYGLTKKIQTEIGLYYSRVFNEKINIARISNVIGPRMKEGFFISDILKKIKSGLNEIAITDYESVRDFIFVEDVAVCLHKIFDVPKSGEIINVSSGKRVVLREALGMLTQIFDTKFNRKISFTQKENCNFIPTFNILANKKLRGLTDFDPVFDLETSLSLIIDNEFNIT